MGKDTKIGWTHHTFNLLIGCAKIAPGCLNCYAAADMDGRRKRAKWGPNGTRVLTSDSYWKQPLAWNRAAEEAGERRRVFCSSLADVFEDWQGPIERNRWVRPKLEPAYLERRMVHIAPYDPDVYVEGELVGIEPKIAHRPATMADVRASLFRLIDRTPWLDWLLLTKRPQNIRRMFVPHCTEKVPGHVSQNEGDGRVIRMRHNVWLGTSVSEQETWDRNVPLLRQCRDLSPVLFVSGEPLLGWIDATNHLGLDRKEHFIATVGHKPNKHVVQYEPGKFDLDGPQIDWMILGAESGPGARPCDLNWAHDLNAQLKAARVPVFNKQYVINDQLVTDAGRFPLALRAQDFPVVPT